MGDYNMKSNLKRRKFLIAGTIIFLLSLTISIQVVGIQQDNILDDLMGAWELNVEITNKEESPYEGHLRLYIIEPVSSIDDYNGDPFHFGLLDYIRNEDITIEDSYNINTFLSIEEYPDFDIENIMIIAALFNEESHEKYSFLI
jgi:hypothetical protein